MYICQILSSNFSRIIRIFVLNILEKEITRINLIKSSILLKFFNLSSLSLYIYICYSLLILIIPSYKHIHYKFPIIIIIVSPTTFQAENLPRDFLSRREANRGRVGTRGQACSGDWADLVIDLVSQEGDWSILVNFSGTSQYGKAIWGREKMTARLYL